MMNKTFDEFCRGRGCVGCELEYLPGGRDECEKHYELNGAGVSRMDFDRLERKIDLIMEHLNIEH